MNTCKTCKHWQPKNEGLPKSARHKGFGGVHLCRKIPFGMEASKTNGIDIDAYIEGWDVVTGPDFGCVHHQLKGLNTK